MTRAEYERLQNALHSAEGVAKETTRQLTALWIMLDDMRRANGFEYVEAGGDD